MRSKSCERNVEGFARPFWAAQGEVDRLFERLSHGFDNIVTSRGWNPVLAIWESEGQYGVEIELPGVPQDAVEVTVFNRELKISCERKASEDRKYLHNERKYGRLERQLILPETVNTDSIGAEMRDGVLYLTLEKKPDSQPRKVVVQSK